MLLDIKQRLLLIVALLFTLTFWNCSESDSGPLGAQKTELEEAIEDVIEHIEDDDNATVTAVVDVNTINFGNAANKLSEHKSHTNLTATSAEVYVWIDSETTNQEVVFVMDAEKTNAVINFFKTNGTTTIYVEKEGAYGEYYYKLINVAQDKVIVGISSTNGNTDFHFGYNIVGGEHDHD